MDTALELLPADYWRWYLTANAPRARTPPSPGSSSPAPVNKDLADVLGNFVNRIAKFTETRFDGVVPDGGEPGPLETSLYADVAASSPT